MNKLTQNIITYLKENIDMESMSQKIQNSHPRFMLCNSQDFRGHIELAFNKLIKFKQEKEDSEKVEFETRKRKFAHEASKEECSKRQRLTENKVAPWNLIPNEIWLKHVLSQLSDKDRVSMSLTSKFFIKFRKNM